MMPNSCDWPEVQPLTTTTPIRFEKRFDGALFIMAIPDYQTLMLPLLTSLRDGAVHVTNDEVGPIANAFGLTSEDRSKLLASGRQTILLNRIHWAVTYLFKANLIERTGRGKIKITDRGREVLGTRPDRLTVNDLKRYPEFLIFQRGVTTEPEDGQANEGTTVAPGPAQISPLPPDELMDATYRLLRTSLAQELLDTVKGASPGFFEQLVVDLLVAMGYGGSRADAGQAIGKSGDEGIDGIIKEDKLGLDSVYVQAKRWDSPVSRPTVQGFAGALEGQRARKGVLITTSQFTKEARAYVNQIEKRIVLIDGERLSQLMLDHGIGVSDVVTYRVQRLDLTYFGEA